MVKKILNNDKYTSIRDEELDHEIYWLIDQNHDGRYDFNFNWIGRNGYGPLHRLIENHRILVKEFNQELE